MSDHDLLQQDRGLDSLLPELCSAQSLDYGHQSLNYGHQVARSFASHPASEEPIDLQLAKVIYTEIDTYTFSSFFLLSDYHTLVTISPFYSNTSTCEYKH